MLKYFKIDKKRDLLVPDFMCYQMDLIGPVNKAIAAGELVGDLKYLPSWTKISKNPIKAKGFLTRMFGALFLGIGGHDELNVDYQIEAYESHARVAMMFFSADNKQLKMIGDIAKQTLSGYEVIVLCGDSIHNGRAMNNKISESVVKEIIESGKPVLIISANMAQRSFSIPEITELYLAYDKGENGTTIQKMSRTLTPNGKDKIGRIFSLSFDPNRDDKFDAMIVETAINYKKCNQVKSLHDAMKAVLRTIDIFSCQPDGAVKMNVDTYLEAALERKGISRVLGKQVNLSHLPKSIISALANGNVDYLTNERQDVAITGKTSEETTEKTSSVAVKSNKDTALEEARKVIVTILENIDVIILGTGKDILADAMVVIKNDNEMRQCVMEEFGVSVETIDFLIEKDVIKQHWVELLYDNQKVNYVS